MKLPHPNEVLKLMEKSSYRPMRGREIAKRLHVPKEGRKAFKKILTKLMRDEAIRRIHGGRYVIAGQEQEEREVIVKKPSKSPRPLAKAGKILGKFVRTGKTGVILPREGRMPPIPVQLNAVKGIRSDSLVVAEITRSHGSQKPYLGATVLDVLGKAGNLEVEKKGIFIEFNLPDGFPTEVMREAEAVPKTIPPQLVKERKDLRDKLIFTIDNDTAKDFDDAVSITRTDKGYSLSVSIADVSYYVKIGSAIDNEALQRATSVYLPQKVVPMLPEVLSDWMCSLVPNEERAAKTVDMGFDEQGNMGEFRIYDSVIKSHARLTYTQVSELLKKKRIAKKDKEIVESLRIMKELYEKIRTIRIERGGLDFDIPEPELIRDEHGRTVDVVKSERNVANGIIEEFMISANNAVAEYIMRSKVPSIYRIHEPPDFMSVKELAADLKKLGYQLPVEGRFKPTNIQRVVFESKDKPEELAINTMILRALKRAIYSTSTKEHFGLALEHYTHFTSPIRRYPDLIVHRIINSLADGRRQPYDQDSLDWMADNSSTKERFAADVERESIKLETVYMMRAHLGEEFDGIVISVLQFGMFIELTDIFVEGFIPKEKIKQKSKRYEIGDKVKVKVIETDVERRRITLELIPQVPYQHHKSDSK